MRLDGRVSRRDMIVAGGATLVAGAMATAVSVRQSSGVGQGQGLTVANRTVSIKGPSDAAFGEQMDVLFPGLRQDPRFGVLAHSAFLVTNSSGPNIRALSLNWSITTPTGTFQTTVPIYRKSEFKTLSGTKSLMTARFDLLQGGKTLLVTPLFNVSPEGFQVQPVSIWNYVRDDLELRQFMSQEMHNATSVAMQVDAAIYDDWAFIGPDSAGLAKHIRIQRNAEHDEAVSVLKLIHAGVAPEVVYERLKLHQTIEGVAGSDIPTSKALWYFYWQSRVKHARVLLDRYGRSDAETFVDELTTLRNQPKTVVRQLTA